MTLDTPLISRALFHPRGEPFSDSPCGVPTETRCGNASVGGYLHLNPTSNALMLFFHGNGEIAADYDSLSAIFTACGVSCWIVDYRGYGRSTGNATYSDMLADAEALFDDLPRVSELAGRQFAHHLVMGRSLGSASAIHLAATRTHQLAGLILDSPYADGLALIQRLGGPAIPRGDLPGFQDNLDEMRHCALPSLIIHGTHDRIIPISDSEALLSACPCAEKKLLRIAGAGHNDLLMRGFEQYCDALRKHIDAATDDPAKGG